MRKTLLPLILVALLLAACGPAAPPTPSPAQVEAAMQSVLATAEAGWTATPSPTAEPSATLPPPTASFTAPASVTPAASATNTAPPSATPWPSATPIPQHLLRTAAPLKLENNSGQGVSLILDGPAYFVVNFSTPLYFIDKVPRGTYTFTAYIGENGPYTGTLHIPNSDQHTLVFHKDKVTIKGP